MKTTKKLVIMVLVLGLTAEVANADFTFGTPTEAPNVNSSARDLKPSVSSDGLSLFFTSNRPGGVGGLDIWVATRETIDDQWGEPVNLGLPVNSTAWETGSISYDGLSFYFSSTRFRGSNANADLWVATRDTINSEWGTPINLGSTVNSSVDQCYTSISADELELYFSSNRSNGHGAYDLWVTTRETIHDPWNTPVNLGPTVNSSVYEVDPGISADGRILFFVSDRSGGYGGDLNIWMTRRATTDDLWGEPEPMNLGPIINSSATADWPNVSADGSTLYFRYSQSGRYDGGDIWQAPILPIVDFNGDGIVDIDDLVIMIENWGTDNTLCDIGPMPWGDGIVDRADLEVIMEYYDQVVDVAAYYKLDEIEGAVAYDSSGYYCDANVIGDPNWQPEGGIIDGALELDGIDDFISTPFVLNPEDGPFSIFAWVKGGAPGQVILSQADGTNWLCTDTEGNLITELKGGRGACDLISEVVLTDGDWHRVGLTWDDVNKIRILYVDDVIAAIDTQPGLEGSYDGLFIGAGKNLEEGTFFSGLIDDVRIYNRVITP